MFLLLSGDAETLPISKAIAISHPTCLEYRVGAPTGTAKHQRRLELVAQVARTAWRHGYLNLLCSSPAGHSTVKVLTRTNANITRNRGIIGEAYDLREILLSNDQLRLTNTPGM